jgi:hypothetical protein
MTTFTKQAKPAASYSLSGKAASANSLVYYAWMFLFTIPGSSGTSFSKVAKIATAFTNVAKP